MQSLHTFRFTRPLKSLIRHGLSAILISASIFTSVTADSISVTTHASWAEILIANVTPVNNDYGSSPSYIDWQGYDGAQTYVNHTKCASFVTQVLQHSYQWNNSDFSAWFGSTSPNAARYHDTIEAENGFTRITQIDNIKPGDILAAKYLSGSSASGHVMIAKTSPTLRTASAPLANGTTQYELVVMDSSSSHHGENDTRKMLDGTWDDGVGMGVIRLYADNNGDVIGYTWSTSKYSTYYDLNSSRHMVVGRLGSE